MPDSPPLVLDDVGWRRDGRLLVGLVFLPWLVCLVFLGGFSPGAMFSVAVVTAVVLGIQVFILPRTWRPSANLWVVLLLLPAACLAWLVALPFGYGHPFADADRQLLGIEPSVYALEPDRAAVAAMWTVLVLAFALGASSAFRGLRGWFALRVLIVLSVVHVLLALVMAVFAPDWQSPFYDGRVRGFFVYPNHSASAWACVIPAALAMARHDKRPLLWWLAAGCLALGVVLTASRGGISVAAVVTAPWWLQALPKGRRLLWLPILVVCMALLLLGMNLNQVRERFGYLESTEDVLAGNGRLKIWQAALPTIAEAGPLGVGAGGTIMSWRRNGVTDFGAVTIDHLHQDPLQWALERGWLGSVVLLLGLVLVVVIWFRRLREIAADRRHLCYGALGGVLVLVAHGCIDLIWQSPAIVLQALLLLSVIAGLLARSERAVSTFPLRLSLMMLALGLVAALWWTRPMIAEQAVVQRVERMIYLRERSGADPLRHSLIDKALAIEAQTGELARLQAGIHIARFRADYPDAILASAPTLTQAKDLLQQSAQRIPGSAGAWIERIRLGVHGVLSPKALEQALDRLQVWANDWHRTQLARTEALAFASQRMDQAQVKDLLSAVIASGANIPSYVPVLAEQHLGVKRTADLFTQAAPHIARKAIAWASQAASLEQWLAIRQRAEPDAWSVPMAAWGLSEVLPVSLRVTWPTAVEQRERIMQRLLQARLPVPPHADLDEVPMELLNALAAEPEDLLRESALRQAYKQLGGVRQHLRLGKLLWNRVVLAEQLARGLRPEFTPPEHMSDLLAAATSLANNAELTLSDELRGSFVATLQRHTEPRWQTLPGGGGQYTVFYHHGGDERAYRVRLDGWTALIVNGQFKRWLRGEGVQPFAELPQGLHHVVLVRP